ncbi:MAG: DNA translocase FtsK 4TM domain-containing protein [Bdellovibrionales bacterium]|nr:DNA translocase FtsK 4TM domain-containing protein [Bdellovibrionales bacterium]
MKLKHSIESQLQEIVFFFSLMLAFSLFLSGVFYLTLSTESLTYILGSFGAALDAGLFSLLGYAFFYLTVISLHMGYITNFHVFSFRDFKLQGSLLGLSLLAHAIIMVLFAVTLSVIQVFLEIPATVSLKYGSGGFVGLHLGHLLYSGLGLYGSILLLALGMISAAVIAGFFELTEVFSAIKSAAILSRNASIKGFKTANTSLLNGLQFLLRGNEISEAVVNSPAHTGKWISNSWHKATDHFHIYRRDEETQDVKKEEKKVEVKKKDVKKEIKKESKKEIVRDLKEVAKDIKKEKKSSAKLEENISVKSAASQGFQNTLNSLKKLSRMDKMLMDKMASKTSATKIASKSKARKK